MTINFESNEMDKIKESNTILLDTLQSTIKELQELKNEHSKEFISDQELRERLGICRTTLYNWRKNKTIPYTRVGKKVFYPWQEIRKKLMK
jgi:predicted DNA-binding transcriptional regulator AlpA